MQVFISSTVYDLIDVRSELSGFFRSMGIAPLLSDDKLSDFKVSQSVNSIETCLVNVEAADEVVVLLDRRYGPRLGSCGFDDISATHLEYHHAVKHKKPIHVFVRDRLEADYAIWKKNKRSDEVDLAWVDKKNYGLFSLLDEHCKLVRKASSTNWYSHFSSSVDLKSALNRRFEKRILPERLFEAISSNRFPMFNIAQVTERKDDIGTIQCKVTLTNAGGLPAFDCCIRWKDDDRCEEQGDIITPGGMLGMTFFNTLNSQNPGVTKILLLSYNSPLGIVVEEEFEVRVYIQPGRQQFLRSLAKRIGRKYRRLPNTELQIEDI